MRLMVNRIEFTPPGSKSVQVIRNLPSADNVAGYLTFLRISALAYELQRRGHLVVSGRPHYQVLMTNLDLKNVTAKDITDAQAQGLVWKQTNDGKFWELGKNVVEPQFRLNLPDMQDKQNAEKICPKEMPNYKAPTTADDLLVCEIANDPEVSILSKADSLRPTLQILKAGFVVTGQSESDIQSGQDQSGSAQFVMRSLIGAMAAASEEQDVFDAITNPMPQGQDPIPAIELKPLIQLTWDSSISLTAPLVELDYLGKYYKIADVQEETGHPLNQSSWNRDMFRIIGQLSSEVTVDISKFPLPTVLQLRPQ
ncbi:MAG TPA: hypothetical protein VGZ48_15055 [Candidatus Acidoferrales bacterium]|nr:hypothetical protein [Candidatus Acidoferrales bacterium]